ncbi:Cobalamin (vitamin B12)-binding domain protein [Acididesulfobacillus acetoxydans]|uniref:Cobalamin (Vitamin B12)-binding domain protein n=1 Tax=Acididesulfobacillus acetoxydans TaxID=1561005 RepID=A0A8S0Y2K6_9FIRM|nr:cobalamin-dependent protein [Acididesulfobacillus acetoxydans]CAA7600935.1 Cobalamin (vitamin B12)-binding domain protein [Acididesulfobacillus acetoxydans]CEJ08908.1 Methionine synthase [Acididesulfobacillus acetoxydans]
MSKTTEELYAERLGRYQATIVLEPTDRIPVASGSNYFSEIYSGNTNQETIYDPGKWLIIQQCNAAMSRIGKLFEENEYYLSELIMSGKIMKDVTGVLEPLLAEAGKATVSSKGTVIIGTVKDDIHDIGKNIVTTLLKGTGFNVVDLGVDVPAATFIQALRDTGAKVLGLSTLLNFTFPQMKNVIEELEKAGMHNSVKVIIGGAPRDEDVRKFVGADYYAKDAAAGVSACKEIYA